MSLQEVYKYKSNRAQRGNSREIQWNRDIKLRQRLSRRVLSLFCFISNTYLYYQTFVAALDMLIFQELAKPFWVFHKTCFGWDITHHRLPNKWLNAVHKLIVAVIIITIHTYSNLRSGVFFFRVKVRKSACTDCRLFEFMRHIPSHLFGN